MITMTITPGLVMVISTPIENAAGVRCALDYIKKLLSLSLLIYKNQTISVFNIPINMYS